MLWKVTRNRQSWRKVLGEGETDDDDDDDDDKIM